MSDVQLESLDKALHDLGNIFMVISANIELIMGLTADTSAVHLRSTCILNAVRRGTSLMVQIEGLYRKQPTSVLRGASRTGTL